MIQKLSRTDLELHRAIRSNPEYADVFTSLKPGEGALVNVKDEGATRQTLKNRLNAAAAATGVKIKFLRSKPDILVFEMLAPNDVMPRRRGRPPKSAAGK
jgi:hypothetical protein